MSNAPDRNPPTAATDGSTGRFEHVIVEHPDGPDECAFVPPNDVPESETTAWIRTTGTGFVDRNSMR